MRGLLVAVSCAALLLLAAPIAQAIPPADKTPAAGSPSTGPAPATTFDPLARQLTGGATVTAQIYSPSDILLTGGTAQLVVLDAEGSPAYSSTVGPDYTGTFRFTAVPAALGTGVLTFRPPAAAASYAYDTWDLTWTDPEGAAFVLRPGLVPLTLTAGGPWQKYFTSAVAEAYTSQVGVSKLATTLVARGASEPTSADVAALPGTLDALNVYFFIDEGLEAPVSGTVVEGESAPGVVASEASAQRLSNTTWASGKPGSTFKVSFAGFPSGWVNRLIGDDAATAEPVDKSFGSWTSPGTSARTKTFTIPKTATPGFTYSVVAQHTNGASPAGAGLVLAEPFQVCTLNPNRPFTRPPTDLIFTGRVPSDGHRKRVILYQRFTAGGQPSIAGGFTQAKGWKRVKSWIIQSDGRFNSGRRLEGRTAWYCLWYAGDSEHWGAWTSVVKVPYYKDL